MQVHLKRIGGSQKDDVQEEVGGDLSDPDARAVEKISHENISEYGNRDEKQYEPGEGSAQLIHFLDDFIN